MYSFFKLSARNLAIPLARAGAVGARAYVALVHYNLGLVARAQGDHRGAAAEFQQSVILEHELGNRRQIAANLEGLAGLAVARKQRERAGRLFGAAGALRQRNSRLSQRGGGGRGDCQPRRRRQGQGRWRQWPR